jgi:hypothetical protein
VKQRKPGQRTLNVQPSALYPSEQEYLQKDAAAKFLRQADGGGRRRRRTRRRPQRLSRRQRQAYADQERFKAELQAYERVGKPEPKSKP